MPNTPEPPKEKITGIILAGGKSSRFGSNKALFEYKGRKLVEYSIEALSEICGEILISTNQPDSFTFAGLTLVGDIFPGCGPLGGIHACLTRSKTRDNIVIGCDMPFLSKKLLSYLIEKSLDYQVVIPMHNGFKESLVSYFKKDCITTLEKSLIRGEFKILEAIKSLQTFFTEVSKESFYHERLFVNFNSLNDIQDQNT